MTTTIRFITLFLALGLCSRAETLTPPTLHLVGDSTMAPKKPDKRPETGWGEMLAAQFVDGVGINNTAVNGRSSKSFIDEGRWQAVLDALKPGDYVFIQFGHNDQKCNSPDRFAYPTTTYQENLVRFIRETRERKAHPILLTSIIRRYFNECGVLEDTHRLYPAVVRRTARIHQVALIDLQLETEDLVRSLGDLPSRELWLWLEPGKQPNYPDGVQDNTHLNPQGAAVVAGLVAEDIREQNLPLAAWLKPTPSGPGLASPQELLLWPEGAPGSAGVTIEEKVIERSQDRLHRDRSVSQVNAPTLAVYFPERPHGGAVLVCPGGGYARLSYDHEGVDIARWFNQQGYVAGVLKYRLPGDGHTDRSKVPLQDAQRAMRLMRSHAAAWGVDAAQVGVIGFSAGGHLASTLGTLYDRPVYTARDPADQLPARPDFMVLVYPVISMADGIGHGGSRANLLGPSPDADAVQTYSTHLQVTEETPPTFLVLADDDRSVIPENSLLFYQALHENKVPAELHIFRRGGHGFSMRKAADRPVGAWVQLCEAWLAAVRAGE